MRERVVSDRVSFVELAAGEVRIGECFPPEQKEGGAHALALERIEHARGGSGLRAVVECQHDFLGRERQRLREMLAADPRRRRRVDRQNPRGAERFGIAGAGGRRGARGARSGSRAPTIRRLLAPSLPASSFDASVSCGEYLRRWMRQRRGRRGHLLRAAVVGRGTVAPLDQPRPGESRRPAGMGAVAFRRAARNGCSSGSGDGDRGRRGANRSRSPSSPARPRPAIPTP